MLIGVPKEIKNNEYRVGLTPNSVRQLVNCGHEVLVQTNAGIGIGIHDEYYIQSGATIAEHAKDIFSKANMIVKVKEPQTTECKMLSEGQILFTYLHLAADQLQTQLLLESKTTAVAYETIKDVDGRLPLLTPMSEVAGKLSVQAGARCLEKIHGGKGILLGGVTGVAPAKVVIIGGGVVGEKAALVAAGMGADVTILDTNLNRLKDLDIIFKGSVCCLYANSELLQQLVLQADLVIGAVLLPGAAAPTLVSAEMVNKMNPGSVLVDVAIDQGGCFETSKATTHQDPYYLVNDIVHYCVSNMPGAVPYTSTIALNNATYPYVLKLANHGVEALLEQPGFLNGLNCHHGMLTIEEVGKAHQIETVEPRAALQFS